LRRRAIGAPRKQHHQREQRERDCRCQRDTANSEAVQNSSSRRVMSVFVTAPTSFIFFALNSIALSISLDRSGVAAPAGTETTVFRLLIYQHDMLFRAKSRPSSMNPIQCPHQVVME
jgi:hypothetical protein